MENKAENLNSTENINRNQVTIAVKPTLSAAPVISVEPPVPQETAVNTSVSSKHMVSTAVSTGVSTVVSTVVSTAVSTEDTGTVKAVNIESETDEFSYLQRNEFTSEIYKVEVRNLGYFGIGEFKKLLKNKLQLDICKIKSPLRRDFAYICFRNQEDHLRAIQTLNGYKWKGKELQAFAAKASADPLMKRRNEEQSSQTVKKKPKVTVEATCPLASVPYEQQLAQKSLQMKELLEKFTNELKRNNVDARKALSADPTYFSFDGIKASPKINGYRNKNEFTVGKNAAGEILVGFRLGSYADGSVEVSAVDELPHLPDAAKWAAKSFQQFVRASPFQPFKPENNSGHFRQLTVRTSSTTGEIMLVVGIYSSNLSAEQVSQLKDDLKAYYAACEDTHSHYKCSCLYYQDVKHREVGQMISPVEHLAGTTHISDAILGLQFRISPLAFFQINAKGADVLYERAIELAAPEAHSTVLDICCGIGTIALTFAKHCKQVVGVEIIPDAIKDAEFNAEANQITNCKFYAGNADDYIQSMVKEVVYGAAPGEPVDVVAIIDPPRNGLHLKSITAIRAAKAIKRLVYIACNPARAQRNWIELGRPESKQYKGDPFFPKKAVAVDMFPHTAHTELVVLFERQQDEPPKPAAASDNHQQIKETANIPMKPENGQQTQASNEAGSATMNVN